MIKKKEKQGPKKTRDESKGQKHKLAPKELNQSANKSKVQIKENTRNKD